MGKYVRGMSMSDLRDEIISRLDAIPDHKLPMVLTFIQFLIWQNQNSRSPEDINWLESDLSNLGSYEPYEWQEGELEEGLPVRVLPETGEIIIDT
jgi:hypothetical protein